MYFREENKETIEKIKEMKLTCTFVILETIEDNFQRAVKTENSAMVQALTESFNAVKDYKF
ncbi:hypothetical protein EP56_03830 [Listeriaceae bacterium FSL A5-0209]|nr:hypothetical protein EP56_03830 [Listeriaceae bacterium FSL A5-0209]